MRQRNEPHAALNVALQKHAVTGVEGDGATGLEFIEPSSVGLQRCKVSGPGGTGSTVPTRNDEGTITLSAEDFALLLEALALAKALCLDMEADESSDDGAAEVRLLRLVEQLVARGMR
jgi:hypothetical protein